MSRMVVVLAVVAAAWVGGCATGKTAVPAGEEQDALAAPAPPAIVHVSNQNWQDIDLFVVRPGAKLRLGVVTSMGTMDFRLPSAIMSGVPSLQLIVSPIGGGRDYITPEISLGRGQTLDLEIENNLRMTSYAIW